MPAVFARPALAAARGLRAAAALAALLSAACQVTEATGPGDGNAPANGSVPAALVGDWRWGVISPTNFWSDHSSTFSGNAYGMSDHYVFARNGTFKEYVYLYTQSYGCRTQVWVEMSGAVEFGGASFAKQVTGGRFKVADTCAASRNYDRAMTAAERQERSKSHPYEVRTDASGRAYLQILDGRYDRAE